MKNKNGISLVILAILALIIISIVSVIIVFNLNKKTENYNVVNKKDESIKSKEEIQKIEEEYKNSENLLNINSLSKGTMGTMIIGTVEKGVVSNNSIIEYINENGNLVKSAVKGLEILKLNKDDIEKGEIGGILLASVELNDIELSSILFKRKEYNGLEISFVGKSKEIQDIEELLKVKDNINLNINGDNVSVEIVNYYVEYVNDSFNYINLYVILNNEKYYEINSTVKLDNIALEGNVNEHMK